MPAKPAFKSKPKEAIDRRLYTLEVFLFDGPITEEFAEKNLGGCVFVPLIGEFGFKD